MEDELCNIRLAKNNNEFIATIESAYGGIREYKSEIFEEVLGQVLTDLQDEFDSA